MKQKLVEKIQNKYTPTKENIYSFAIHDIEVWLKVDK